MTKFKKSAVSLLSLLCAACLFTGTVFGDYSGKAGAGAGKDVTINKVSAPVETDAEEFYDENVVYKLPDTVSDDQEISLIVDRLKGKQIGFLTLAILFVGIAQISLLEVTTAFAGLAIFAVAFAVTTLSQTMNARLSVRAIIVIGLAITILVVGFRIQEHFAEFLATVLDKNATLTGRTELWDSAFGIIGSSPVFGYGINDSVGAFVPWRGMYWQVHNQWLQLLYDGSCSSVPQAATWKKAESLTKSSFPQKQPCSLSW